MNKPIRPAPAWRYRRLAALSALALSTLLNARANTLPEISVQGLQQGSASTLVPSVTLPTPGADHGAELTRLLASPVDAKAAVRIALLNNPGLQVMLGTEGLSISDQFGADAPAKLKARKEITLLSANTHKAWINAVAAAESVKALQAARLAAENSAELAMPEMPAIRPEKINNISAPKPPRMQPTVRILRGPMRSTSRPTGICMAA